MAKSLIQIKSYAFALKIIDLSKYLYEIKKEFVLSKQLLKSGIAPGALIYEAEHAKSRPDFLNKQNIALKETNECKYWLNLLKDSNYLSEKQFSNIISDCTEIIKMLSSSVKTTRASLIR